ncbi:hypothetical protein [Agrobacterium radiobacter]|uniref:hypothetical protein n=1 Tax=Agrobacterium radiobacter TaxID=362 RepID=UPI003F854591
MSHSSKSDYELEHFALIFGLISAARNEAIGLKLTHLADLTNIALLQLVTDWEEVDPIMLESDALEDLLKQKAAFSAAKFANLVVGVCPVGS